MTIIPLIMSGGAGTRLWPLSRRSRPKQFLALGSDTSLFQNTVLRCNHSDFDQNPVIVASEEHRFLVAEALREISVSADILLEPFPRNSCAAIVAGCLQAMQRNHEALVLVLAADHQIRDIQGFVRTILAAQADASTGKLVTFGIKPDYPSTGYGYIRGEASIQSGEGTRVSAFVEKPDANMAERYVNEGYLWNSGNFLFSAAAFLAEAERYIPELVHSVKSAFESRQYDLGFERLEAQSFKKVPSISVDYAVMEKTENAMVFAADHDWSDIGTWQSVWRNLEAAEKSNVLLGDVEVLNSSGNLVHSDERLTALVGVENHIVVVTRDSVLVAPHAQSEHIGELVDALKIKNRREATQALKVYRPWGNYETLDRSDHYKVKRIVISPGEELSLQKHVHRSEHWIVVEGTPEVTIGEAVNTLQPNQSVYIPADCVHQIANRTDEFVILIEVQTGTYFGEDDIVRLSDKYNRG